MSQSHPYSTVFREKWLQPVDRSLPLLHPNGRWFRLFSSAPADGASDRRPPPFSSCRSQKQRFEMFCAWRQAMHDELCLLDAWNYEQKLEAHVIAQYQQGGSNNFQTFLKNHDVGEIERKKNIVRDWHDYHAFYAPKLMKGTPTSSSMREFHREQAAAAQLRRAQMNAASGQPGLNPCAPSFLIRAAGDERFIEDQMELGNQAIAANQAVRAREVRERGDSPMPVMRADDRQNHGNGSRKLFAANDEGFIAIRAAGRAASVDSSGFNSRRQSPLGERRWSYGPGQHPTMPMMASPRHQSGVETLDDVNVEPAVDGNGGNGPAANKDLAAANRGGTEIAVCERSGDNGVDGPPHFGASSNFHARSDSWPSGNQGLDTFRNHIKDYLQKWKAEPSVSESERKVIMRRLPKVEDVMRRCPQPVIWHLDAVIQRRLTQHVSSLLESQDEEDAGEIDIDLRQTNFTGPFDRYTKVRELLGTRVNYRQWTDGFVFWLNTRSGSICKSYPLFTFEGYNRMGPLSRGIFRPLSCSERCTIPLIYNVSPRKIISSCMCSHDLPSPYETPSDFDEPDRQHGGFYHGFSFDVSL